MPFADVCRAIGDFVSHECWPVLVSLECYVDEEGQKELVKQMVETWGDKLVRGPLEGVCGEITPADLRGRIVLMVSTTVLAHNVISYEPRFQVEYQPPSTSESDSSDEESGSDSESDREEKPKGEAFARTFKKEQQPEDRISDELAGYGFYARSMKPRKGWLSQSSRYKFHPICSLFTPGFLR